MSYSEEEKDKALELIFSRIESGESLRSILLGQLMPSSQTFYKWLDEDEEKSKRYARACTVRADNLFDEMLDIADTSNMDISIVDGVPRVDGEVIQRSKLRIDTRKWVIGKLNSKKYGDKKQVDHTTDGKEIKYINLGGE